MVKEFLFTDRESLFKQLAADCEAHLKNALTKHGKTSFLVSGGSTPAPLYEALSLANLDWSQISVALVDERWVNKDHPASNEALLYRSLLQNHASTALFISMKTPATTAIEGCHEIESRYQALPKPFAVSILGMGNDGHTASLFPHAQGLSKALETSDLTTPIMAQQSTVTGTNVERISLSLNGLLQSERLIVLLTGQEKLDVFRAVQAAGSVEDMPIRALLRQDNVPIELYWAA